MVLVFGDKLLRDIAVDIIARLWPEAMKHKLALFTLFGISALCFIAMRFTESIMPTEYQE